MSHLQAPSQITPYQNKIAPSKKSDCKVTYQGSPKPPSGRPGQVDFPVGQVTFHAHLPDGQGPCQNIN